jgi:hypothetical protein
MTSSGRPAPSHALRKTRPAASKPAASPVAVSFRPATAGPCTAADPANSSSVRPKRPRLIEVDRFRRQSPVRATRSTRTDQPVRRGTDDHRHGVSRRSERRQCARFRGWSGMACRPRTSQGRAPWRVGEIVPGPAGPGWPLAVSQVSDSASCSRARCCKRGVAGDRAVVRPGTGRRPWPPGPVI